MALLKPGSAKVISGFRLNYCIIEFSTAILPVAYLPPINHFMAMAQHSSIMWDTHEFFHKQFYYNRSVIYGPNGMQKLVIPVHKRYEKTPLKDIKIGYETPWQKIHWRSYEAAYRRSPYFEYYEAELSPLYLDYTPTFLLEWNLKLFELACKLLGIKIDLSFTNEYCKTYEDKADYRNLANPVNMLDLEKPIKYQQVFEERHGFIPNLSIIDLLFCEGPHAKDFLKQ